MAEIPLHLAGAPGGRLNVHFFDGATSFVGSAGQLYLVGGLAYYNGSTSITITGGEVVSEQTGHYSTGGTAATADYRVALIRGTGGNIGITGARTVKSFWAEVM